MNIHSSPSGHLLHLHFYRSVSIQSFTFTHVSYIVAFLYYYPIIFMNSLALFSMPKIVEFRSFIDFSCILNFFYYRLFYILLYLVSSLFHNDSIAFSFIRVFELFLRSFLSFSPLVPIIFNKISSMHFFFLLIGNKSF